MFLRKVLSCEWIRYIIFAYILGIILSKILLIGHEATGSMEPTIKVGDYVLGNQLSYNFSEPERGDIIVFDFGDMVYVKRVIAVEGDEVSFYMGEVYVNEEKLEETAYLESNVLTTCSKSFTVPEDCVFVLGDNREVSYDSRFWDEPYVKIEDIRARIIFIMPVGDIKQGIMDWFSEW